MSGIEVETDLESDFTVDDGTCGDGMAISTGSTYKKAFDSKEGAQADEILWDKSLIHFYLCTDPELISAYPDCKYFFLRVNSPQELQGVATLDPFVCIKIPIEQANRYNNIDPKILHEHFQEYLPGEWQNINLENVGWVFNFSRYNYQHTAGYGGSGHQSGIVISSQPVWTSRTVPTLAQLKRFDQPLWSSNQVGGGYEGEKPLWVNGRGIFENDIVCRTASGGGNAQYHITREPGEWKKAVNRKKKRAESAARSRLKQGVFNITATEGLLKASIPHPWLTLSKRWNGLAHERRIEECAKILKQIERRYKAAKEMHEKREITVLSLEALLYSPNITETMRSWSKASDEAIADDKQGEAKRRIGKYLMLMLKRHKPLEEAWNKELKARTARQHAERQAHARAFEKEAKQAAIAKALAIQKRALEE